MSESPHPRPALAGRAGIAMLLVVIGLTTTVALLIFGPMTRAYICDGSLPVWMLEAQEYGGGGCAWTLPSSEAPPNADWRLSCTGLCPSPGLPGYEADHP